MSTHGKKVTTTSESHENPIVEGSGLVTSDSLAAESVEQDGGFAANKHAAVSSQPSASTTSNVAADDEGDNVTEIPAAKSRTDRDVDAEVDDGFKGQDGSNKIAERAGFDGSEEPSGAEGRNGAGSGDVDDYEGDAGSTKAGGQTGSYSGNTDEYSGDADSTNRATQKDNIGGLYKTARNATNANENLGGRNVQEEIDSAQANLPLPDQPAVASDWQSADARNVNVDSRSSTTADVESAEQTTGYSTTKSSKSYPRKEQSSGEDYGTDTVEQDESGTQETSEGGRNVNEEIERAQANLPLPEQPPVASDWQSMDARNVNLDLN